MKIIGIICEYNPFHNGHAKQLRLIRERYGADAAIVCLMSGNYVQRGEPAIFEKAVRAQAAALCGADLVLELPLTYALRSAEGFADGGVEILDALGADALCFGCECGDGNSIMSTAKALLTPEFDTFLREELSGGNSFAKAREAALSRMLSSRQTAPDSVISSEARNPSLHLKAGGKETDFSVAGSLEMTGTEVLRNPNDILAVEYCKAILRRGSDMELFAILREGDYHGTEEDTENPSASWLRQRMIEDGDWKDAVPENAAALYASAPRYTMAAGERAVLARLRTLPDEAYAALPFGAEGLWSKFRKACRTEGSVEGIIAATKSKRYARSRIQRMLMCAYLGITEKELQAVAPHIRILAFNERGRTLLNQRKREKIPLINAGQTPGNSAYYRMECRAADLFSLFCTSENSFPCGQEHKNRIFYQDLEKNTCNP